MAEAVLASELSVDEAVEEEFASVIEPAPCEPPLPVVTALAGAVSSVATDEDPVAPPEPPLAPPVEVPLVPPVPWGDPVEPCGEPAVAKVTWKGAVRPQAPAFCTATME